MALWAAFYRSRFVKDKEDKDMKDKPDRKDSAGEPVDEVEQIQREILTRCAGKEIQETSTIRKKMKNYFRKKTTDVAQKIQQAVKGLIEKQVLLEITPRKKQEAGKESVDDATAEAKAGHLCS